MSGDKLLIIDDDVEITEMLAEVLDPITHNIDCVHTVEDGLKKLNETKYCCLLVDIKIKESNGADIIKFLKNTPKNSNHRVPTIIISGFIDDNFKKKFKNNFAAIIGKPFDFNVLNTAIDKYVQAGKRKHQLSNMVIEGKSVVEVESKKEKSILFNKPTIEIKEQEQQQVKDEPVNYNEGPFQIDGLNEKVENVLKKLRKNTKIGKFLKKINIRRDDESYIKVHTGLVINISTGILRELEWSNESTLEKFVLASFMKDSFLEEDLELIKIKTPQQLSAFQLDESNSEKIEKILKHPKEASLTCSKFPGITEDVLTMIEQHHERPDGSGFPNKIDHKRISTLSTVFIIANDLADYIIENKYWQIERYLVNSRKKFKGSNFNKVMQGLEKVFLS